MEIVFDTLYEIKYFVLHSDIMVFTSKEQFFGGIGMIITDKMPEKYECGFDNTVTTIDSAVYRSDRGDIVIVTPYASALSWLTGELIKLERRNNNCSHITEIMEMSCKGFFLLHSGKEYCAKELLLFVIEFLDNVCTRNIEQQNQRCFEEG